MSLLVVILKKGPVERIDSSFFPSFFALLWQRQVTESSLLVPVNQVSDNNFDIWIRFYVLVSGCFAKHHVAASFSDIINVRGAKQPKQ